MSTGSKKNVTIALVVIHLGMLAAYVLPKSFIPQRLTLIANAYVRPLFHQQWMLFAPDPPLCSSEIEVSYDGDLWEVLFPKPDHYLEQRIIRNIAHHVREGMNDGGIHPSLERLLLDACGSCSADPPAIFRLREECVIDANLPGQRNVAYTMIPI